MWKGLTRRESRIAVMLLSGCERQEISRELAISPKTFDTHRQRVMQKIGVRNEVQILRRAIVEGVVRVDEPRPGPPSEDRMIVVVDERWMAGDAAPDVAVVEPELVCTCEYTTGACEVHGCT